MDYSAANTSLWNPIIQMGIMAALIILANVLRRKVKFIRQSLMPTAVIAGFILLIIKTTGLVHIDPVFLEKVTYHSLGFGFIALSLKVPEKDTSDTPLVGAKSGALIVGTYLVQAVAGLVITLTLAYTFMPELFKASGVLLPMAYGQGPGQANNIGTLYEQSGMIGGKTFGLSLAAAGFLCACIVGVIYLNVLSKKNKLKRVTEKRVISGSVTVDTYQHENEIPIAESIDKFSIQVALVGMVYLLTFLLTLGIESLAGLISDGLKNTVSSFVWGFNFILGSLVAIIVRSCITGLRKTKLMTRQYQNNYLLSRISGLAFDLMIITGIASIDISDLQGYWVPFILLSVVGGVVTFLYLKFLCDKIYPDYKYEAFLGMFGMLTGTISSGILLLREVDPEFETPASNQLVVGSSFGIAFGFPVLILVKYAANGDTAVWITLALASLYLVALTLFMLLAGKKKKKK
ncbi:MAG: sodium:glutamate symporter [Clostridia bacterium]|nr:sodium:glutamate symporter [Clostridia bacterium]